MKGYRIFTYHHIENGLDEKQERRTMKEAQRAAIEYFHDGYEGVAVYGVRQKRLMLLFGNFPTELLPA